MTFVWIISFSSEDQFYFSAGASQSQIVATNGPHRIPWVARGLVFLGKEESLLMVVLSNSPILVFQEGNFK